MRRLLRHLAVIGAGLMGAGITTVSIDKGYKTLLKDVADEALLRGEAHIDKELSTAVKKRKINALQKDKIMANLTPTLDYADLGHVDMVIEAVFEDLALKHKVIAELEKVVQSLLAFLNFNHWLRVANSCILFAHVVFLLQQYLLVQEVD